jgi:hypothetical protein
VPSTSPLSLTKLTVVVQSIMVVEEEFQSCFTSLHPKLLSSLLLPSLSPAQLSSPLTDLNL